MGTTQVTIYRTENFRAVPNDRTTCGYSFTNDNSESLHKPGGVTVSQVSSVAEWNVTLAGEWTERLDPVGDIVMMPDRSLGFGPYPWTAAEMIESRPKGSKWKRIS